MGLTTINLTWPEYQLFPYERDLAVREAQAVLKPYGKLVENGSVKLRTRTPALATRLTYFKSVMQGGDVIPTTQGLLERGVLGEDDSQRRQATRYSVHGLHEYKGKFNPQVAKAVINYLGLSRGRVLDPFCGSGTTLVESAHAGVTAFGCDINPLAVFIANTKLAALGIPASELQDAVKACHPLSN
jgi:site-specific DNA-methyltransferase (cytosine-N4-specific)